MTDNLASEISRRVARNKLWARDAYCLLFDTKDATALWFSVKKEILHWLTRNPQHISALLSIIGDSANCSKPEYHVESIEGGFLLVGKIKFDGVTYTSERLRVRGKKVGRQQAGYSLIQHIVSALHRI